MTSVEKARSIIKQNGDCGGFMCNSSDDNRCPCWREGGYHICTSAGDDKEECRKQSVEACKQYLLEHDTTDTTNKETVADTLMWPTAEDTQKVKEVADKLLAIKSDPVEHPSHYANSSIECWDAIKASMTHEAFCGYLKGNVQKYIWRYEKKVAPVEDLRKAAVYLNKLIEEVENGSKSN